MPPSQRERIIGSLLAGAIGDALGAAIEFDSIDEIRSRFGPSGLTTYAPAYGRLGAITDDTQMTLFTAEGLIRSLARYEDRGVVDHVTVTHLAYLRWLATQGRRYTDATWDADLLDSGWLVGVPELHSRRAPGMTCTSALAAGGVGRPDEPRNDSKGCGGVMRVAPVGLIGERAFEIGADLAAITHGHPTGYLASGAFAVMIGELLAERTLHDAVEAARVALRPRAHGQETIDALDAALDLAASGRTPTPEAVETLGAGWVAEEALAIGVYCALVAPDLRAGLLLAVNHGGDSDSTGSIAGSLLGAMHGVGALPQDLLEDLELAEVIEQVGEDLASAFFDHEPIDLERYPPY
jgi:ADP-ribosylglycohydrolase